MSSPVCSKNSALRLVSMSSRLLCRGPALDLLHEEYAKHRRTDAQAPIVATGSVHVDVAVRRVYEVLSAVADWPAVDPAISKVRLPAGFGVDSPFSWRNGRARIESRFAVVDPDHELTWTGVSFGARAVRRQTLLNRRVRDDQGSLVVCRLACVANSSRSS